MDRLSQGHRIREYSGFANPSTDGTDELLAALAEAGEIMFVPHDPPAKVGPQRNAARLANERGYIPDGAWASWLDADEFLNVKCGNGRLESLIDKIGNRVCILVPWRIFGDGGTGRFTGVTCQRTSSLLPQMIFRITARSSLSFGRGKALSGFPFAA